MCIDLPLFSHVTHFLGIKTCFSEGNHGYNNSLPSMHPFFLAMGPAFKTGASVETFNNVDIYPLMCHILKLKPAPNNGSLDNVRALLREESVSGSTFIICK